MPNRAVLALLLALSLPAASPPAAAEGGGPVYKDLERFGPRGVDLQAPPPGSPPYGSAEAFRPGRPTDRSPGYVGSDFGLGKPAFTGLGSRPDWGRSSE